MLKLDNIKKYYIFRFCNKRFVVPIWVVYMLDQGLSLQQIAFIAAASTALSFILEIPSGSVSDMIGHKQALVLSLIGQGVAMLLFLGGSFYWIVAGSLMYFGMGTFMTGTHQALLYEYLQSIGRSKEYTKFIGRAKGFSSGFSMMALLFTGFVYAYHRPLTFMIGAVIFFVGAIVIGTFQDSEQLQSVEKQEGFMEFVRHFRVGFKTVLSNKPLFWLMAAESVFLGFALAATEFQQIIFTNIGLAIGLFGVYYSIKRAFSALMAPALHRLTRRLSAQDVVGVMLVSVTLYYLLISLVTNHYAIIPVILFVSFTIILSDVVVSDHLNRLIPTGSRATTLSIGRGALDLMKITGVALVGLISTWFTIETTHAIIGILLILLGPLFISQTKNHTYAKAKH